RLKMLREGIEDFEYMTILSNLLQDASYANSQIDSVFPTAYQTNLANANALYTARFNVACRIMTTQNANVVCSDPNTWNNTSPTLVVHVSGSGTGTVTSTPAGINCGSGGGACSAPFSSGQ